VPVGRLVVRGVVVLVVVPVLALLTASPAEADPSAADWARLRACESSGRYDVVATHEHYGAYQFDMATWRSVGGEGVPSDADAAEQDYRALRLYRMRGWQPWECAGILGLQPEKDARSTTLPSRDESAYMRPSGPADRGAAPTWPGLVFRPGDCDRALRTWQLRMNAWGHDFDGTGCYGSETGRAVMELQHRHHLPETGRLGPRTWHAAWETPPGRS
jgi:hypothetical protein